MTTPMLFLIVGVLVVLVIGFVSYGVFILLNPTRTAQDRLADLRERENEFDGFSLGSDQPEPGLDRWVIRIGALASSPEDAERLRRLLVQAGFKSRHALEIFNGIRVTAALCLPLFVIPLSGEDASVFRVATMVLVAAAAGYYLPQLFVTNSVEKRKKVLLAAFPDSLDLLVSSVEAGLGLDAAFRRVASEMEHAAPDLSREYQLVNHEISAGLSRVDALKHLEERTGLDEVRSLVNMLAQSERFGTSIAKSLRVHAKVTRQKRMSKAEEEAAKVSPKLTVVMILFLLPVLMSILIGPAVINVMNTFGV